MAGPQRSIIELTGCAAGHLEAYCSPSSGFGWPDYDTDPAPGRLVPGDLLAPAWLSYPIPTKYLQLMSASDGNAYDRLRKGGCCFPAAGPPDRGAVCTPGVTRPADEPWDGDA